MKKKKITTRLHRVTSGKYSYDKEKTCRVIGQFSSIDKEILSRITQFRSFSTKKDHGELVSSKTEPPSGAQNRF